MNHRDTISFGWKPEIVRPGFIAFVITLFLSRTRHSRLWNETPDNHKGIDPIAEFRKDAKFTSEPRTLSVSLDRNPNSRPREKEKDSPFWRPRDGMRVFTTGRFWANRMLLFRIAGFAVGLVLVVKLFFKVKYPQGIYTRQPPHPITLCRSTRNISLSPPISRSSSVCHRGLLPTQHTYPLHLPRARHHLSVFTGRHRISAVPT